MSKALSNPHARDWIEGRTQVRFFVRHTDGSTFDCSVKRARRCTIAALRRVLDEIEERMTDDADDPPKKDDAPAAGPGGAG